MKTDHLKETIKREILRWDGIDSQEELRANAEEMAKRIARYVRAAQTKQKKKKI